MVTFASKIICSFTSKCALYMFRLKGSAIWSVLKTVNWILLTLAKCLFFPILFLLSYLLSTFPLPIIRPEDAALFFLGLVYPVHGHFPLVRCISRAANNLIKWINPKMKMVCQFKRGQTATGTRVWIASRWLLHFREQYFQNTGQPIKLCSFKSQIYL